MLRKCLLCFGICCSFASSITAQSLTNEDWIMDNVFLEDDVEEDWASWIEEMEELKANPLDVKGAAGTVPVFIRSNHRKYSLLCL